MSQDIVQEVTFFSHSVMMGFAITFFYDWILILRRLVKHRGIWISAEDLLFWFICGISVFYMLYWENNGILRWFAVAGAMIGMGFYKGIIGKHFINIMSTIIYKIMWCLLRVIQVVLNPLKRLYIWVRRYVRIGVQKSKNGQKCVKNKLTVFIKMLKMVLCKH